MEDTTDSKATFNEPSSCLHNNLHKNTSDTFFGKKGLRTKTQIMVAIDGLYIK